MIDYYAQRAAEYERIYDRPERQIALGFLKEYLGSAFPGEKVLEIACGTGYWTQFIAKSAAAILATDLNPEVIEIALKKDFWACPVQIVIADAYSLDDIAGGNTAGFCGFWWSHVPISRIREFLSAFHSRLQSGSKVAMVDNIYVEGSSTPISRRDSDGNTYQLRRLENGSEHEILKNFPSNSDLHTSLSGCATDISLKRLNYFWIVEYKTV